MWPDPSLKIENLEKITTFQKFTLRILPLKCEFQNPKSDSELTKLIENFINSSGGSYSLVSARELNDEPKCLLSGDFLCSEVVANSSAEVVEYFKQAMRKEFEVMTLQSYVICVKSLTDHFELK